MPPSDWGGQPLPAGVRPSPADHYDAMLPLLQQGDAMVADPTIIGDPHLPYLGALAHGVAGLLRAAMDQS